MSRNTTTEPGEVIEYRSSSTCWILELHDGRRYPFGSCYFHMGRPDRFPKVGDLIEIVFENARPVYVRPRKSRLITEDQFRSVFLAAALQDRDLEEPDFSDVDEMIQTHCRTPVRMSVESVMAGLPDRLHGTCPDCGWAFT